MPDMRPEDGQRGDVHPPDACEPADNLDVGRFEMGVNRPTPFFFWPLTRVFASLTTHLRSSDQDEVGWWFGPSRTRPTKVRLVEELRPCQLVRPSMRRSL